MKISTICGSSAGNRAHARHHLVFRSLGLETSCFIGQSLADDALDRKVGTGAVVDPELFTVRVAEIELGKIPMKVRFANMEVATDNPALEDREIALDRISVERPAHIFFGSVVHDFMPEVAAHMPILARVVGAQDRSVIDLADEDWAKVGGGDAGNVHGTDTTVALDQRQHSFLAPASAKPRGRTLAAMPVLFLAANEGFIGFDSLTLTTERSDHPVLHRFADAMRKEPSGFHAALKHPLDLAGRDALLASAHQVDHLKPQMKRKVAVLEDGAHANGEGATASVALAKAYSAAFALQAPNAVAVTVSTMRAIRSIRPKQRFDIRESRFFVMELRGAQNRLSHVTSPYLEKLHLVAGVVKCNTPDLIRGLPVILPCYNVR